MTPSTCVYPRWLETEDGWFWVLQQVDCGLNPDAFALLTAAEVQAGQSASSFWEIPLDSAPVLLASCAGVLAVAWGLRQLRKALD